jgi:thioredoxin 1
MIKHVGESEFNEEVKNGVVVVDFYADWCGPCKMIAPVLEEVDKELSDKVTFLKVDVDSNQRLAQEYGITSIPSIIFFKDGIKKEMHVGFLQKNSLVDKISTYLR